MLSAKVDPLADVRATANRLRELAAVRSEQREVFAALAESFKRAKNIVGDTPARAVDVAAFVESAERSLHAALVKAEATPASDPRGPAEGGGGVARRGRRFLQEHDGDGRGSKD